jgi:cytochrome P450
LNRNTLRSAAQRGAWPEIMTGAMSITDAVKRPPGRWTDSSRFALGPDPVTRFALATADRVTNAIPWKIEPLALPPKDSGLKPVMGDYGFPLIGHTFDGAHNMVGNARARYAKYGPISWAGMLGTKAVLAVGPAALEEVSLNRDKAFGNAGFYDYLIGAFFRRGVMLLDFDEHLHHRRIMQQAFTRPRLVSYLSVMNDRITSELDAWEPKPRFLVYSAAKQLTLDVATDVFVGISSGATAQEISKAFIDAVHGGQAIVRANMPGGVWARGLRGRRTLEEYFRSQLPAKRAGSGDDLFSVLCHAESEDGHRFSDDDIVNHMIFAMMAAHDTSTITVAMMAYFLGKHHEWQERVRAECLALGKATIDYDDQEKLPLLDCVMKETLRMNAPVGGLFRETVKDTELLGRYIPANTRLVSMIHSMQRMEPWWNDPDTFDPERFAEPRREDKSHRYAWAPFGGGAHKCIGMHFGGMEVKAIMHQMLQRFRWTVPAGYEPPYHYGTGPTPSDGLPVRLERL